MKNLLFIFFSLLLFIGCDNKKKVKPLLSPQSKYKTILSTSDIIIDKSLKPDSINNLESVLNIDSLLILSSKNGVYVFNKEAKQCVKFYKINLDDILWTRITTNHNKSKTLVTVSTGQSTNSLIFQLDNSSFGIDWLAKYQIQLVATGYSHNGNEITLGTGYFKKPTISDTTQYYSSLFSISSDNGTFNRYYEQRASVSKIVYSKNDSLIYAILDWPHSDVFLWNTQNKLTPFGKDYTRFYNCFELNNSAFLSIAENGIYKWNKSDSKNYEEVYKGYMNPNDFVYQQDSIFILVNYKNGTSNPPTFKYFNKNFELFDSIKPISRLNDLTISNDRLVGINPENNTIVSFTPSNKQIKNRHNTDSLNKMIKNNKTTANKVYSQ